MVISHSDLPVFDIENEACLDMMGIAWLFHQDPIEGYVHSIDDDDHYDSVDGDTGPIQVVDPAGSSHIFSQFEGGLVYFRFQVGEALLLLWKFWWWSWIW